MSDVIGDWEIISKKGNKYTFWEMLLGILLFPPAHPTFTFTLRGGEARTLALDHVEYVFRHRLQKGDIDPQELFTHLERLLRPAGQEAVQEFTKRCSPLFRQPAQ